MSYVLKMFSKKMLTRELHSMLTTMRPGHSRGEKTFIEAYIDTLPGVTVDGYGNRHVRIGEAPVLWSSHTDSVHTHSGFQTVVRDGNMFRLHRHDNASCLGADCATGVWLMRNMILRSVPGYYIFHRDEEVGGLGSSWLAKQYSSSFDQFQFAIALDRKGYSSVITHQGGRCCSDAFAESLATQLGGRYKPDSSGLFTDTANYTRLVPECTNLSVGYGAQHTSNEQQNVPFALELLDKLTTLDITKLTVSRKKDDPNEYAYPVVDWKKMYPDYYSKRSSASPRYDTPVTKRTTHPVIEPLDDWMYGAKPKRTNYEELLRLCKSHPDSVADWLDQYGISASEVQEERY
jgi:acetylornithine deacetylase/succinyl-diaminopimelate desuccinylase-like protein